MTKHDENSPCIDPVDQIACEWVYDGVSTPVAADWYCKTCGCVDINREPPNDADRRGRAGNEMSDTPRTDAVSKKLIDFWDEGVTNTAEIVPVEFARQLERELSQAHGDIRALLARLAYYEREP